MKQKILCLFMFLFVLNEYDKIHSKVEDVGIQGRAEIKITKIASNFKLLQATNQKSEYRLLVGNALEVRLFQYGGDAQMSFR